MSYKNQTKHTVIIILLVLLVHNINCYPIEVTGKNITYYKLTPNEGSGSYNFNYGTHDGSKRSERGFIKHEPGSDKPLLVVTGSFKYPDANEVFYIADEQGYRIVSKEEVDELQKKLPNEIAPTTKPSISSGTRSPKISSDAPVRTSSKSPLTPSPALSTISPLLETNLNPEGTSRPVVQIPVTESQIIKLNVIQPITGKPVTCPPGQCSGTRQSKIFKIKSLKFG